jgi:hypothetical protein
MQNTEEIIMRKYENSLISNLEIERKHAFYQRARVQYGHNCGPSFKADL